MSSQEVMREHFINNSLINQSNITRTLHTASDKFYRCDPKQYIENATYHQLTNFDQAYIVNEANMDDGNCDRKCPHITKGTTKRCDSGDKYLCSERMRCDHFYDCDFVRYMFRVCEPIIKTPYRRYESIDKSCGGTVHMIANHGQFPFSRCDNCLCYCDDVNEKSDRIVSLQVHESDIRANEVITGVRVVKLQQVFYLQIQVGKLMPFMRINQSSLNWVPIKPIKNIDYNNERSDYYILKRNTPMDLDIITMNQKEVLTGNCSFSPNPELSESGPVN